MKRRRWETRLTLLSRASRQTQPPLTPLPFSTKLLLQSSRVVHVAELAQPIETESETDLGQPVDRAHHPLTAS